MFKSNAKEVVRPQGDNTPLYHLVVYLKCGDEFDLWPEDYGQRSESAMRTMGKLRGRSFLCSECNEMSPIDKMEMQLIE